ncbi:unnamed protein product [Dibothriocephalus latus]|uniref:Tetraspanin n=1 Tax=Dibothriocephalus latus TaxID=60516 RepID=A0A3P7LGT4_DIBLA|nr:unnamed protein product [Dibothriocephalus latus]
MISGFGIYLVIESLKSTITQTIGVSSFVLAVGLLVFLLGFLGCIGACTENVCMLKTFAEIITVLIILEITAGILLFVYREKIEELTAKNIQYRIKQILTAGSVNMAGAQSALDHLQSLLKCCGGEGPQDWKNQEPDSCCAYVITSCQQMYAQGCGEALYNVLKDKTLAMAIIIVLLAFLEIGAIVAACVLAEKLSSCP